MHGKRTATPAKAGKLHFAHKRQKLTGWVASCHLLWGGAQQPSHSKGFVKQVLSKGVSLARLHTPHNTLLMRTELTQAKLKPLAKVMQTCTLSLVIRMPPCKNTHAHAHVRYVHCLQFQAPTSFSVATHVCAAWISRWSCCRQRRQCFLPRCPDTKQSAQEICRVSSKKHLQTPNSLCW